MMQRLLQKGKNRKRKRSIGISMSISIHTIMTKSTLSGVAFCVTERV